MESRREEEQKGREEEEEQQGREEEEGQQREEEEEQQMKTGTKSSRSEAEVQRENNKSRFHLRCIQIQKFLLDSRNQQGTEREILEALGDTLETSEALRWLIENNKVKRFRSGGRADPDIYMAMVLLSLEDHERLQAAQDALHVEAEGKRGRKGAEGKRGKRRAKEDGKVEKQKRSKSAEASYALHSNPEVLVGPNPEHREGGPRNIGGHSGYQQSSAMADKQKQS